MVGGGGDRGCWKGKRPRARALDAVHRQTALKTIPPAGSRSQGRPQDESLALPGGEGDGRWGASHRH